MFTSALLALFPLAALAHSSSHHHSLKPRSAHAKRGVETLDDADTSSIGYKGNWTHGTVGSETTLSWTDSADASYNFTTPKGAKGIVISSTLKNDRGSFKVLMDGKDIGTGTTFGGANFTLDTQETASKPVFTYNITDKAKHTFEVVKTSAAGKYLSLDSISISGVNTSTGTGSSSLNGYFYGGNNYFAYSMAESSRLNVLNAMQKAGMQYLRIFITEVGSNSKNSDSIAVQDLEHNGVGDYDDTILEAIDQLMLEASQRGIKLLIAPHDRYSLGFWGTDAYAIKYGIAKPGTSGAQEIGDASAFYTSTTAGQEIDARYTHILNHKNKLMGNKAWKDLSEGIFAIEAQNEPQGHMNLAAPDWVCQRATTLKNLVGDSGILIGTGGGVDISTSQQSWNTDCKDVDAIMVHDYGTNAEYDVQQLSAMKQKYAAQGKIVIFEEWGAMGSDKTGIIQGFVSALKQAGVPWSYWEIVDPGMGDSNYEIWTNEGGWTGGLAQGGNAPSSGSKRDSDSAVLGVRTSSRRVPRRSQASKRNDRPVERVP